jgi:hypothetical protein
MFFGVDKNPARIWAQAILLLTFVVLPGCSHQVLTFFFTGVPEPGQVRTSEASEPGKTIAEIVE